MILRHETVRDRGLLHSIDTAEAAVEFCRLSGFRGCRHVGGRVSDFGSSCFMASEVWVSGFRGQSFGSSVSGLPSLICVMTSVRIEWPWVEPMFCSVVVHSRPCRFSAFLSHETISNASSDNVDINQHPGRLTRTVFILLAVQSLSSRTAWWCGCFWIRKVL